jgi:hypothetical protein
MDTTALVKATLAGLVLQLAMVLAGHHWPAIKGSFAVGGMGFSLIAGLIFTALARGSGWPAALGGGAIAGGVCALIGIGVSAALKDVPPTLLILGTLSSVITGALGGALGKLIFRGQAKAL